MGLRGSSARSVLALGISVLASLASACPSFCGDRDRWSTNCNINACASCNECNTELESKSCSPYVKGDLMFLANERCMQWCQVRPGKTAQCINCACRGCAGCAGLSYPPTPLSPSPPPFKPPPPPSPILPPHPALPPTPPEGCDPYTPFDVEEVQCNTAVCEITRAFEVHRHLRDDRKLALHTPLSKLSSLSLFDPGNARGEMALANCIISPRMRAGLQLLPLQRLRLLQWHEAVPTATPGRAATTTATP